MDFKHTLLGSGDTRSVTLESCGKEPVQVKSISLKPGSSTDYSLESLPDNRYNTDLTQGDTLLFTVRYTPGENGEDDGVILVETNDPDRPVLEIPIKGTGTDKLCPIAKIEVDEGLAVLPQTTLHLKGNQSTGADGNTSSIVQWKWTVKQPDGSTSVFIPSDSVPNPIFEANVAGLYTFQLDVWDDLGQKSCEPGEVKINVNPIQDIHVELVWETPGDPDEFDEGPNAGTDLDLHFKHPLATGWFDLEYDVFWYNLNPNWGLLNPNFDNDPSLDRDDSDGGGPENLNMNNPEDVVYRIGVHYWRDPGQQSPLGKPYGDVKATVRVFIRGVLRLETKPTSLKRFDFWEVATIDWSTQTVNELSNNDGTPLVTPNYVPPIDLDALSGN